MAVRRRCPACGSAVDPSSRACWSCSTQLLPSPVVSNAEVLATPTSAYAAKARRVGVFLWAGVVFTALAVLAMWFMIRTDGEDLDLPSTLSGIERVDAGDPFNGFSWDGMPDAFAWYGTQLSVAVWRDMEIDPIERMKEIARDNDHTLGRPMIMRSRGDLTIRCYHPAETGGPAATGQAWCGWIDGRDLGVVISHGPEAPKPPIEATEELFAALQG
jgi:hypothetical protein